MSRVQRRDNTFVKDQDTQTKIQRIYDLLYGDNFPTNQDLTDHAALKTGVHGIPSMSSGQGLLWNGSGWTATDLATQAELNATEADLDLTIARPIFLKSSFSAISAGNSGTSGFWMANNGAGIVSGGLTSTAPNPWKWVASNYPAAPTGKTMKWRLICNVYPNNVSIGFTITVGWRRFTLGGGAGGTSYTFISSDSELRTVTTGVPTAATPLTVQGDFNVPADDNYGSYYSWSGTAAANSFAAVEQRLYLVYV